jgi:hypothetical protein
LKQNVIVSLDNPFINRIIIAGILIYIFILSTVLLSFHYCPPPLNLKISIAVVPIGFLIFFSIAEKILTKNVGDVRITLFIIAWTIVVFFITGSMDLGIFVILIVLALLMTKEIAYDFTPVRFRYKLNVLIYLLLLFFVLIIGEKILDILST